MIDRCWTVRVYYKSQLPNFLGTHRVNVKRSTRRGVREVEFAPNARVMHFREVTRGRSRPRGNKNIYVSSKRNVVSSRGLWFLQHVLTTTCDIVFFAFVSHQPLLTRHTIPKFPNKEPYTRRTTINSFNCYSQLPIRDAYPYDRQRIIKNYKQANYYK